MKCLYPHEPSAKQALSTCAKLKRILVQHRETGRGVHVCVKPKTEVTRITVKGKI